MNCNLQLEYSIIGTLFTDYKRSIKYFQDIKPEFFYNKMNQITLEKAKQCYMNKEDFTEFTAIENLKSLDYDIDLTMDYTLKCTENVLTFYELESNLKILKDLYKKRELEKILSTGLESKEDFNTNIEKLSQELYELKRNSTKSPMKSMQVATMEFVDMLASKENHIRADTGFSLIDSILQGMSKGQLIGLAARPGCGKSALALNITVNVAKKNKAVAMFSQEMESYEIIERMMANQANIPMNMLINKFKGTTKIEEEALYNKVIDKANDFYNLPIYISDVTRLTTEKVKTECQQIKNLSLIVIDYLQLMSPIKKEQNRNLEIGQITRELKILASDLQCPILLLSQLNRAKDETDKPSLNDYRDSGSIEQDLVKSIMLWKTDVENSKIGLTINKNRR